MKNDGEQIATALAEIFYFQTSVNMNLLSQGSSNEIVVPHLENFCVFWLTSLQPIFS